MSLETKLYTLLSGAGAVTAIASTRIYPLVAPQDADAPYITYQRIATPREYSHQGYSNLENPLLQIDCWSSDYATGKTLSEAVISAMRGSTTFHVSEDRPRESYEDDMFRFSIDFDIWNEDT